jgi:endonuclease YncB( thermonuclease family)
MTTAFSNDREVPQRPPGSVRMDARLLVSVLLLSSLLLGAVLSTASAAMDETYGIVTNTIDGDTIDVMIEKADSRIDSGVERIRLADVDSPEINTLEGIEARDFAYAVLLGKRVFIDLDDLKGRDAYNRLVGVVYLCGESDTPVPVPCFNRMLVDSGHAVVDNFTDNEFNPQDWWTVSPSDSIQGQLEGTVDGIMGELRKLLAEELEKVGRAIIDQIRG